MNRAPRLLLRKKNIIGPRVKTDARSLAGKRRAQALRKAPDVAVEMLRAALKAGHRAKYVLFDTWFSTPRGILRITRECRLHVIAMIKKAPKVFYEFEGKKRTSGRFTVRAGNAAGGQGSCCQSP